MRRTLGKKLTAVVSVLAFASIAGTALAANIATDESSAGQGVAVVDGFTVTNIEYDATPVGNEEQVLVTEVRFEITRDNDGDVQGPPRPSDADAEAFVQLRDGATLSDWAQCSLTNGFAVCPVTGGEVIEVELLSDLSVVAYDTFESNAP